VLRKVQAACSDNPFQSELSLLCLVQNRTQLSMAYVLEQFSFPFSLSLTHSILCTVYHYFVLFCTVLTCW